MRYMILVYRFPLPGRRITPPPTALPPAPSSATCTPARGRSTLTNGAGHAPVSRVRYA